MEAERKRRQDERERDQHTALGCGWVEEGSSQTQGQEVIEASVVVDWPLSVLVIGIVVVVTLGC